MALPVLGAVPTYRIRARAWAGDATAPGATGGGAEAACYLGIYDHTYGTLSYVAA